MKVKAVIVDEVPESCVRCLFGNEEYCRCDITREDNWTNDGIDYKGVEMITLLKFRPEWCPLVTERDCKTFPQVNNSNDKEK